MQIQQMYTLARSKGWTDCSGCCVHTYIPHVSPEVLSRYCAPTLYSRVFIRSRKTQSAKREALATEEGAWGARRIFHPKCRALDVRTIMRFARALWSTDDGVVDKRTLSGTKTATTLVAEK